MVSDVELNTFMPGYFIFPNKLKYAESQNCSVNECQHNAKAYISKLAFVKLKGINTCAELAFIH